MIHHLYFGDRTESDRHTDWQRLAPIRAGIIASTFLATCFASPAMAADRFYLVASPTAQQITRYERGVAKLFDDGSVALVRVTEVAAADGRIALEMAVFNKARGSINFSLGDVQISTTDGRSLPIIPYEQLV